MAKVSVIQRNLKRIKCSNSLKDKRDKLRAIIKDKSLSMGEKFIAQAKLSKLPRDSSQIRVRLRCFISGRPRGNYRKFGLSRINLREMILFGLITGMTKSSW